MTNEPSIHPVSSTDLDRNDRLFVPLQTEHYRAFESGGKTWELRGQNPQFNQKTVQTGRTVELRRGYSTDESLWGMISDVRTFESVDEIVDDFPFEKIRPGASSAEFRDSVHDLLGQYDSFIAFEVTLTES